MQAYHIIFIAKKEKIIKTIKSCSSCHFNVFVIAIYLWEIIWKGKWEIMHQYMINFILYVCSSMGNAALLEYIISLIYMYIFPLSIFIGVEAILDILDNYQAFFKCHLNLGCSKFSPKILSNPNHIGFSTMRKRWKQSVLQNHVNTDSLIIALLTNVPDFNT